MIPLRVNASNRLAILDHGGLADSCDKATSTIQWWSQVVGWHVAVPCLGSIRICPDGASKPTIGVFVRLF